MEWLKKTINNAISSYTQIKPHSVGMQVVGQNIDKKLFDKQTFTTANKQQVQETKELAKQIVTEYLSKNKSKFEKIDGKQEVYTKSSKNADDDILYYLHRKELDEAFSSYGQNAGQTLNEIDMDQFIVENVFIDDWMKEKNMTPHDFEKLFKNEFPDSSNEEMTKLLRNSLQNKYGFKNNVLQIHIMNNVFASHQQLMNYIYENKEYNKEQKKQNKETKKIFLWDEAKIVFSDFTDVLGKLTPEFIEFVTDLFQKIITNRFVFLEYSIFDVDDGEGHANLVLCEFVNNVIYFTLYEPHGSDGGYSFENDRQKFWESLLNYSKKHSKYPVVFDNETLNKNGIQDVISTYDIGMCQIACYIIVYLYSLVKCQMIKRNLNVPLVYFGDVMNDTFIQFFANDKLMYDFVVWFMMDIHSQYNSSFMVSRKDKYHVLINDYDNVYFIDPSIKTMETHITNKNAKKRRINANQARQIDEENEINEEYNQQILDLEDKYRYTFNKECDYNDDDDCYPLQCVMKDQDTQDYRCDVDGKKNGEQCTNSSECYSENCVNNRCRAKISVPIVREKNYQLFQIKKEIPNYEQDCDPGDTRNKSFCEPGICKQFQTFPIYYCDIPGKKIGETCSADSDCHTGTVCRDRICRFIDPTPFENNKFNLHYNPPEPSAKRAKKQEIEYLKDYGYDENNKKMDFDPSGYMESF